MAEGVSQEQKRRWHRSGIRSLDPDLVLAVLDRALIDAPPTLAVMNLDLTTAEALAGPRPPLLEDLSTGVSIGTSLLSATARAGGRFPSAFLEEIGRCHLAERAHRIERYLRNVTVRVLSIPDDLTIAANVQFRDLGLDSLTALTFVDVLRQECGLRLPATTLFEYPTISALGHMLNQKLPGSSAEAPVVAGSAEPTSLDRPSPVTDDASFEDLAMLDDLAAWQEIDATRSRYAAHD